MILIVMPSFNAHKYLVLELTASSYISVMLLSKEMATSFLILSLIFGTHFLITMLFPLLFKC